MREHLNVTVNLNESSLQNRIVLALKPAYLDRIIAQVLIAQNNLSVHSKQTQKQIVSVLRDCYVLLLSQRVRMGYCASETGSRYIIHNVIWSYICHCGCALEVKIKHCLIQGLCKSSDTSSSSMVYYRSRGDNDGYHDVCVKSREVMTEIYRGRNLHQSLGNRIPYTALSGYFQLNVNKVLI